MLKQSTVSYNAWFLKSFQEITNLYMLNFFHGLMIFSRFQSIQLHEIQTISCIFLIKWIMLRMDQGRFKASLFSINQSLMQLSQLVPLLHLKVEKKFSLKLSENKNTCYPSIILGMDKFIIFWIDFICKPSVKC